MTSRDLVYGAFVDYYGNIQFKRTKQEGVYSIFTAKVKSGLNLNRYLFAIVPTRTVRSETETLNNLDWESFQTRTTDDNHIVPAYDLFLDENRKQAMKDKLTVVDRDRDNTYYITDSLPIRITLIHDPKKKNYLQYPDQLFLYQALETFNCVVTVL